MPVTVGRLVPTAGAAREWRWLVDGLRQVDEEAARCGVCLDTFHLNIEEADLHAAIRLVGQRLASVDVADNNRLAPGLGALDWPAIVATLRDVGYEGALAVEFLPPLERTPLVGDWSTGETDELDTSDFVRLHGSGSVSERRYDELTACSARTLLPLIRPGPADRRLAPTGREGRPPGPARPRVLTARG